MSEARHRIDYTLRMHRAQEYIDTHLDQMLEIADVARVANFSAFHFHRVFSAWLGETFGDYLRRRRLEMAASRLVAQPRVPVMSIALAVGFGSSEAFARAFKLRFGCTPTAWRTRTAESRHGNPDQRQSKPDQAGADEDPHPMGCHPFAAESVMKVSVIEWPSVKVAYLRHVGPYGESLSRFWQEAAYPWMISNGLLGHTRYGVSHDDPGITAAEKCRYDAAVEVTGPLAAPGKAALTTLPGGRYAVTAFSGRAQDIGAAWERLLREWLPCSGLQLDARPFIEHYSKQSTFDSNSGVFTCDLAVPVAPL